MYRLLLFLFSDRAGEECHSNAKPRVIAYLADLGVVTYCNMEVARFTIKMTRIFISCFTRQCEMNLIIFCSHQQLLFHIDYWLFTYCGFQVDIAPLSQTEYILSHTYLRTTLPPPWQITQHFSVW